MGLKKISALGASSVTHNISSFQRSLISNSPLPPLSFPSLCTYRHNHGFRSDLALSPPRARSSAHDPVVPDPAQPPQEPIHHRRRRLRLPLSAGPEREQLPVQGIPKAPRHAAGLVRGVVGSRVVPVLRRLGHCDARRRKLSSVDIRRRRADLQGPEELHRELSCAGYPLPLRGPAGSESRECRLCLVSINYYYFPHMHLLHVKDIYIKKKKKKKKKKKP